MRPFKHFDAGSVDEGLALLSQHGGTARVLAGGTDLLGVLKSEILPHSVPIDPPRLSLPDQRPGPVYPDKPLCFFFLKLPLKHS